MLPVDQLPSCHEDAGRLAASELIQRYALILLHPIRWLDGHAAKVVSEIVFDARYGCFAIGAGASQLSATISSRIYHGDERVVNVAVRDDRWRRRFRARGCAIWESGTHPRGMMDV